MKKLNWIESKEDGESEYFPAGWYIEMDDLIEYIDKAAIKETLMKNPHFRCGPVNEKCPGCEYEANVTAKAIKKLLKENK